MSDKETNDASGLLAALGTFATLDTFATDEDLRRRFVQPAADGGRGTTDAARLLAKAEKVLDEATSPAVSYENMPVMAEVARAYMKLAEQYL